MFEVRRAQDGNPAPKFYTHSDCVDSQYRVFRDVGGDAYIWVGGGWIDRYFDCVHNDCPRYPMPPRTG